MKKRSPRPTSDDSPGAFAVPGIHANSSRPAAYPSYQSEVPHDDVSNDDSVDESLHEEDGGDRSAQMMVRHNMIAENESYVAEAYQVLDEEGAHRGLENHPNSACE